MSRLAITKAILTRAIAGKEGGKTAWQMLTEKEKVRADQDFPLNMRILGRVNLDLTSYLLAENKLLMEAPCDKGTIVEIGTIRHGDGLVDYLARISPDNATEDNAMTLLLVETQRGQVLSTKLFTLGADVYPADANEWGVWLDENEGILGSECLNTPNDGPVFPRYLGEGDRVEPMRARENVLADRFGDNVKTNSLTQMMFAREVQNDAGERLTDEFALVSVVNEECVEILYGVPITVTPEQIIGA